MINKAINKRDDEKLFIRWLIGGYEQLCSLEKFKSLLNEGLNDGNTGEQEATTILEKVKGIIG